MRSKSFRDVHSVHVRQRCCGNGRSDQYLKTTLEYAMDLLDDGVGAFLKDRESQTLDFRQRLCYRRTSR
jgi:hypothetical protein